MVEVAFNKEVISNLLSYAKDIGFKKPFYSIEPGSEKGDNFVGIISKLQIRDAESDAKTLNIIIKSASTDKKTRDTMSTNAFFIREIWAYNNLISRFKNILVNTDNFTLAFPECAMSCDEDEKEWLALEDMSVKGFVLHRPRLASLNEVHVKAAFTALARFHALSFVLKSREPTLYENLLKQVPDSFFPAGNTYPKFKAYMEQASLKAVDVTKNTPYYKKMQVLCSNLYERLVEVVKPQKYVVFCHGDYWKNNMLFQYKNNLPVAVCPLDYQIVRASPPVTDILYLLFCNTTREERSLHLNDYLEHYYKELLKQFDIYGLPPDTFPLVDFQSEMKRCGIFGLGMAIMVLAFMTCSDDNVPSAQDIIACKSELNDEASLALFTERLTGVIADCVDYGYI